MDWLHAREPVSAWTHFAWMAMALPGTWYLWRQSDDPLKRISLMIFGFSMMFCYASSYLYHAVPDSLAASCSLIDHIGIYLLIAGTVTPIGLVILRGWWRLGLVGGIWVLALLGIALRLSAELPLQGRTVSYLFVGWIGFTTIFELGRTLTFPRIRWLWIGGVLYSIGAVCNGLHWPALYPGVFEAHELFHLFVMAGTACHYWFMLAVVVPYRPSATAPLVALLGQPAAPDLQSG
jgi:hemolysin III